MVQDCRYSRLTLYFSAGRDSCFIFFLFSVWKCLFCFLSSFLDGQAQVLLRQRQASITREPTETAQIECVFEGMSRAAFQALYVHWYRHLPSRAPELILFIQTAQAYYDNDSYKNKYSSKKGMNICTFTINDINPNDEGTYYCAYWQNHRTSKPQVACTESCTLSGRLSSEHENQITYVCLVEKFYPEVIRVTWTDEKNEEVTGNVVKGDTWKATENEEYSIGSWLTVPVENKDKKYYCKYEHESQERSLPTQGID
uniref:Ig-like domain-containing protein n=1 Tax=Amazona collaria TaxID=241587 RepID=A0A8B9FVW8_9PSIT